MTVVTSIALLGGLTVIPNVSAHTSGNSGLLSNNQQICYSVSGLNLVELNGNTNQGSTIKTHAINGMNDVNSMTDFNVSERTSCSGGTYSWVTSTYLANANDKATTTPIISGSVKYIMFSNNADANMINSGSCQWYQNDNIEYVANHEFGHYAGLIHQSGSTSHTMMHTSCDTGYAIIRSGDISQINGWY
ncbi:exported protein of unknown function [Nitrosopumilus adriaticus]|uniref:Peptidase M10 metallopeptidase domain-containing protein n=2 Tax=Nitrosopumilus adriaticus TaxID=1580092 RepID=A0A0D5C1B3_9ARCH|nr:exported protein of unknown function [Nitrosopumilus adriaticus]